MTVTVNDNVGGKDSQSAVINVGDAPLTAIYPNMLNGVPGTALGADDPRPAQRRRSCMQQHGE